MTYTISKTILIDDCCLLFDSEIINYVDFLNKLSPSKLRSAYRKKAFETHPDRSLALGKNRKRLDSRFKDVSTAYERLDSIIQDGKKYIIKDEVPKKKRAKCASRRTQTKRARTTKQKSAASFSFMNSVKKSGCTQVALKKQSIVSDRYYEGIIPRRELLIGQFLYYSGLISWDTLNQAIAWQRRQRPIIGKIALDWGILSAEDIRTILKEQGYKDHFGEYAQRNGYITKLQHLAIVGKQKQMQPPICRYFIQLGLLGNYDIKKMTESLKIHNTKATNIARRLSR